MDNWLDKKDFGGWCEDYAARRFQERGWRVLGRHVCFREGELDLILERDGRVRFVEVKGRRGRKFGGVVEALTTGKIRRLRRAVGRWREREQDFREGELWFFGMEVGRRGEVEVEEWMVE
jgi:Holliday junction resolvase-like predicted endonuclease